MARLSFTLNANNPDGGYDNAKTAFENAVLTLRDAGFTVDGGAQGNDKDLGGFMLHASDVEKPAEPEKPAKAKASKAKKEDDGE